MSRWKIDRLRPDSVPDGIVARQPPRGFFNALRQYVIRVLGRGGLFVAVMEISTMNSEEKESISAELSGSYGLFSAEAKMNLEKIQKDYSSEIHINVYHEGGPVNLFQQDIRNPKRYTS